MHFRESHVYANKLDVQEQTSVSHSSTKSEVISLDAVLRMDGIPALDLWDLVIEIFHSVPNKIEQPKGELRGNPLQATRPNTHNPIQFKHTNVIPTNVDRIPSNTLHSGASALLYVFEGNEAVIKMIIKGRSSTMRHVSRTHRVALDWLCDRINLDSKIQIKYIDTKKQLANILTKGNFTRDEWNHLLCLFNISHFSSINNLEAMSKRAQEDAGEERFTAKSKPMMNLVSRYSVKDPNVLASIASESLGKTKSESQNVPLSSWNEQQSRTERPVMGANSSNYSEWSTLGSHTFVPMHCMG